MESLIPMMLFFLFTFLSFNPSSSNASQLSYKDHCASIVPDSTPNNNQRLNSFPLGDQYGGYYTGGDMITGSGASWNHFSFYLKPRNILATQASHLFKIEHIIISLKSTNSRNFSYGGERLNYGHQHNVTFSHGDYVTFKLDGFWSESSGKVCMIGTGSGYSKAGGNPLKLDAVLKLDNVLKSSNISTLIRGTLESLSSKEHDDESYFEPISLLMFPKENYNYTTLDSVESEIEFSSGESDIDDAEKGFSLNLNSLSFCSSPLSRAIRELKLEYSSECNSSKNCTPISGRSSEPLPPTLMSLKAIECSHTKKHTLRILVDFYNTTSYYEFYQGSHSPQTMLVGEGWWDEKKNMFCAVLCHIMGTTSSSSTHVGDCSVRLKLRFPSILSINNTGSPVGEIWSNKTAKDPGYFRKITLRNDVFFRVGGHDLKYEYSLLDKVNKSCETTPSKPVKDQGKTYPNPFSNDMRFDMSVRESNKRVVLAWGYSVPFTIGDHFSDLDFFRFSDSTFSSSIDSPPEIHNNNRGTLFNMSYKITLSLMSYSMLEDRNSLFNKSSKISAEGIYDAEVGTLCMIGCRDLHSINETPKAQSVDCEILLKFQFPPTDGGSRRRIKGSIESTREKSDPLYFKSLDLSASAFYTVVAQRNVWRMDMEVIMTLISTTLACVFVGMQLYHVKKNPHVLPFISLTMMSILTLGHMIPLVLNFEALLAQNHSKRYYISGSAVWVEVNETSVRLITMVAFLLQFRLMYLTWASRMTTDEESKKGLFWSAEKKASCFTLPLYAAGLLITLLLKLNKNGEKVDMVFTRSSSSWENLKSYGGLVLDGFLLPQVMLNLFSNMREGVLSCSFYLGTTLVRLLPHAYDLYRTHNYASLEEDEGSYNYNYADPSQDFYSTAWDILIPIGGILLAIIIYLQQRFGAHCILPGRFKGKKVYEKLPEDIESEPKEETVSM